jgi:hypothetical protein
VHAPAALHPFQGGMKHTPVHAPAAGALTRAERKLLLLSLLCCLLLYKVPLEA